MTNKNDPRSLVPGDFFEIDFGYDPYVLYAIRITERGIWATSPEWLVSSQTMFTFDDLATRNLQFIGTGKLRRWRALLPFIRDLIPMYSKPKALRN